MTSAWIRHVKAYQAQHHGMSYGEAMKAAKSSYHGSGVMVRSPRTRIGMQIKTGSGRRRVRGGAIDWGNVLGSVAQGAAQILPLFL
jgi:hypothetical protein